MIGFKNRTAVNVKGEVDGYKLITFSMLMKYAFVFIPTSFKLMG